MALVLVLAISMASAGCQAAAPDETPTDTGTPGAAAPALTIDLSTLTGFSLEVVDREDTQTHLNQAELARYLAGLVLEGCTPLSGPPSLEGSWSSEYRLTLYGPSTPICWRIIDRDWPPEARAHFLEDAGHWYSLRPDILTTICEMTGAPGATTNLDPTHQALLAEYGWTPWYALSSYPYRLPERSLYQAGDFPTALFWAHRAELSAAIGLDLASAAGREVTITIYRLDRGVPDLAPPGGLSRAVIVTADGMVIGAWIDKVGHAGDAMALNREKIPPTEEWLSGWVDGAAPLEAELAGMEPEEIIRAYWAAIDSGDHARAHACETKTAVFRYLFLNMDDDRHANESFARAHADHFGNYVSVDVLGIEEVTSPADPGNAYFRVQVNQDLEVEMTTNDGLMTWSMTLVKTPTGWRIEGLGTGG